MTPLIAHGGHWLVDLLYVAPLVVVLGALGYQSLRARRQGPGEHAIRHRRSADP